MQHERYPFYLSHADSRSNLRCVGPRLYVGGATAVLDGPAPRREWAAAVDLHGSRHPEAFRREPFFGALGRFLRVAFEDGAPVPEGALPAAADLYRGCSGPVLISCAAGVSRSASVAYGVLRAVLGLGHDEALRRVACPGGRPLPATLESARRWAGALSARCDDLRAAHEGRREPPTDAEIDAHHAAGGWWLWSCDGVIGEDEDPALARRVAEKHHREQRDVRWWAMGPNRLPGPWPVAFGGARG